MEIYYAHIEDFDDTFYKKALFEIPQVKRSSITAIKNEKAKKESLLAWYIVSAVSKKYSLSCDDVAFSKTNKPYFINSQLHFNITHSNGFVSCAFSKEDVGIDAEEIKSVKDSVMRYVLCENEMSKINLLENKNDAFIKIWTLKESYLKHSGKGIASGLKEVDFSPFICENEFVFDSLYCRCEKINSIYFSICSKDNMYTFLPFSLK